MIHSREERAERFKMFSDRRNELRARAALLVGCGPLPIRDVVQLIYRESDNFKRADVRNFVVTESGKWDGYFMMLGDGMYEAKLPKEYMPAAERAREGERFEEFIEREVSGKMPCGEERGLCMHGDKCYLAENCRAARGAGYMTTKELMQRQDVYTEFRW